MIRGKDINILLSLINEIFENKAEPEQIKILINLSKIQAKSLAYDLTAGRGSPIHKDQIENLSKGISGGYACEKNNIKIKITVK